MQSLLWSEWPRLFASNFGVAAHTLSNGGSQRMRSVMPWTGVSDLKQEMDRLFNRFLEPRWADVPAPGEWGPRLDLSETKESLVVSVDVPGIDPKDMHVSLQGDLLTIQGEKCQAKEERYHQVER